tara:strand:+ start:2494 stop:2853 length:360 start_codon:yes stop_codon:yes gene_type:complete
MIAKSPTSCGEWMRKNKFGAVKTVIDGITFASKKEAERYKILALLESQGKIDNLRLQPRFPLMVNGVKIGYYIADFQYDLSGKQIIEDVKSKATRTPVYQIKKKILKTYDPPVEITEIY